MFAQIAAENNDFIQKTESFQFTTVKNRIDNNLFVRRKFPLPQEFIGIKQMQNKYIGTITLEQGTTDDAILKYQNDKTMALNFANQYNPGGGYLAGARAQEEALCRQYPYLYASLACHKFNYYPIRGVLISEDVPRHRNRDFLVNVNPKVYGNFITCAAPNLIGAYGDNANFTQHKKLIKSLLDLIFSVPASKGYDVLIVGAWGCGAFAPPLKEDMINYVSSMARLMKKFALKYVNCYKKIVFQIPMDKNYDIFKTIFDE
jgi:uncharacterized protein (TIGR02452 family)